MNSFQITTLVQAIFPWIVVTMENCVLSENERAFMIAGLVAVFLLVGEPFPLEISELIMPTGDGFSPSTSCTN